jgi:hypothetical protein
VEEGALVGYRKIILVAIWMAMSPIPVGLLLPRAHLVELTILDMPLAKVYPVGTVFAVIPHMVVTMVAVVVASVICVVVTDDYFLGSASPGCYRGYDRGSQKK